MPLRLLLILSLSFCSYGYNSRRQLGAYQWYDQAVLSTAPSVQQHQLYHQLPDPTAVLFTPQYSQLENERRSEPEQVRVDNAALLAADFRLARVYPVLIHFLSPEPLEGNLEAQYQLTLEPVPEYHMMEIRESRYQEQERTDGQPTNETASTQPLEFGTKITTSKPPEEKPSHRTRTGNAKEQ